MDTLLGEQTRYLELRLHRCYTRPSLHGEQILAYNELLARARQASDIAGYYRAVRDSGKVMAIARAEWMDRYRNRMAIHRAFGDRRKLRAAEICFEAAESASDSDFVSKITAAKHRAWRLSIASDAGRNALTRMLLALAKWATETDPAAKRDYLAEIRAHWAMLREQEEPGAIRSWSEITGDRFYRQHIPFDRERMAVLDSWMAQAVPQNHAAGPEQRTSDLALEREPEISPAIPDTSAEFALPSVADVAAPYRAAHDAIKRNRSPMAASALAAYERIFEIEASAPNAPAFLRQLAEEELFCRVARDPHLALARDGLRHFGEISQPHAEHHYRSVIEALENASSPTEIEYEIERLDTAFSIETAWHELTLSYALQAISKTASYAADPTPTNARNVISSYRFVCDFFGADWEAIFTAPRIWDFFCKVLFVRAQQFPRADDDEQDDDERDRDRDKPASHVGEIGAAAAGPFRDAVLQFLIDEARRSDALDRLDDRLARLAQEPAFTGPEDMKAYISRMFQQAMNTGEASFSIPKGKPCELLLWNRPVKLAELLAAAASPKRPPIDV